MGYSFVSTEAKTGKIITDLTLLNMDTAKVTLGRFENAMATLPIDLADAPADWQRATKKNGAHIILLEDNPNDPTHGIPLAGWRINRRTRDHTDQITLDLTTVEQYLDSRYIQGKTYTNVGQNDLIADLITSFVGSAATTGVGIPIRVQYTTAGSGKLRTITYNDQDDMTVYQAMQNLMGVIAGPEWTLGWEWQTNPERITPVLYVGDRIGTAAPAGMAPYTTFEMPGPMNAFQLIEDYSVGAGATDVMAVSSGQGNIRPQSTHMVNTSDPDLPTVEYRFTPSTSITDVSTLNDYATGAVNAMVQGSTALAFSAPVVAAPQLNIDWFAGDDVGYVVGGLDQNGIDTVPSFPGGISGVARVAGWELRPTDQTPVVTPILVTSTGSFG